LATSASTALSINNSQTTIVNNLVGYTSSLQSAIDVTGGNLTVLGNLTVQGETTTLNTANLIVEDKLIELAKGTTTSADANGGGIYISGADASVTWNSGQSRIDVNKNFNVSGNITLSGTVDGTEISQLSSSFNTISASYLIESASVSASIKTLNAYTSSNNTNISAIHTSTASLNTFTSSTYNTFSTSVDTRLDTIEASLGVGGSGIGADVDNLILSASASIVLNNQQQASLNGLLNSTPSASVFSVTRLAATASNLAGGATGTTNQLNALNASSSAVFQSASSLSISASNAFSSNQTQNASIGSLNNFTQSFTPYSESVSSSIAQISASIAGGNITLQLNSVTSSIQSINNFTSSFNNGINSTGSRIERLETTSSNHVTRLNLLETSSANLVNFSQSVIPQFSSSIDSRFLNFSSLLAAVSNSAFSDAEFIIYSQSAVTTSINLYNSGSNLSASIWADTYSGSLGLSASINQKIQSVSSSITSRINTIVIGTGFIERPEFNSVTSSLFTSASALSTTASANRTSSSVLFTSASSLNLSASALQTTASGILSYTASLKGAINAVGADLYVSGNIIAQQYIVSTSTYYVTESNFEGDHNFGDQYGDTQVLNGITTINGALILNVSSSNPVSNPSFVSISADIRVVSGTVIAPIFVGTFEGAYSSSIQTNISGTNGFSAFLTSITSSVNDTTQSLSSSISSSFAVVSNVLKIGVTSHF
jgi:putative membrane protein